MLLSYMRRHYKIIVLMLVFIAVFALVFSLYSLPVEAVMYAAVLDACIGTVFFFMSYQRDVRQHRDLIDMLNRVALSIEELPVPRAYLEKDYQALLKTLFKEKMRVESEANISKHELIDYYTLWVHQIKTPIAAMRLLLQSEENAQNPVLTAELFKIEQYVDMVLQYLRLGSSTNDFVIGAYDLDTIIRQAVRKYAKLFILKKIELDFSPTELNVLTDEKWLCFVIEQILANCLKYTLKGKVCIYLDGMTLIIEDSGIGIQLEDLPRVFDKGFTGYNGREDKKSTGIGLYLCKRVFDLLGHTISIESETGIGTRVMLGFETIKLKPE